MPWMKDLRVYELTENLEGLDGLYIASDQCELRSGVMMTHEHFLVRGCDVHESSRRGDTP